MVGHGFSEYLHADLDLEDMALGQGHDTPLGYGQQLCEILSRSNLAVRSWHGHRFSVCVHSDLNIRDMSLGQDHVTPVGHGQ